MKWISRHPINKSAPQWMAFTDRTRDLFNTILLYSYISRLVPELTGMRETRSLYRMSHWNRSPWMSHPLSRCLGKRNSMHEHEHIEMQGARKRNRVWPCVHLLSAIYYFQNRIFVPLLLFLQFFRIFIKII